MATAADDPLTLGLRALATLAQRGPLDVAGLARLHRSRVRRLTAVVDELEREGLVHRLSDEALFAVTLRGAALIGEAPVVGVGPRLH